DLGGRDHFQRARHLAGVLHALDLGLDFSAACHLTRSARRGYQGPATPVQYEPVFLKSSMPALNAPSISSFQAPLSLTLPISSPAVFSKCACSASSKLPIRFTGTSSM